MRHQGKILEWNDEDGYGFILSAEGKSVFVHILSFTHTHRRPIVNEPVSYTLGFDAQGRTQARDVWFITRENWFRRIHRIPKSDVVKIAFAVSFLIALAALVILGLLEITWLVLYYGVSIITYRSYAHDKEAAAYGDWRTKEQKLHLMSLIGGWPGALIAQVRLRHKTSKPPFLVKYWFTVIVNCMVFGVIVWKDVAPLKVLLNAAT